MGTLLLERREGGFNNPPRKGGGQRGGGKRLSLGSFLGRRGGGEKGRPPAPPRQEGKPSRFPQVGRKQRWKFVFDNGKRDEESPSSSRRGEKRESLSFFAPAPIKGEIKTLP